MLTTAVGPWNPVSILSNFSVTDTEYQHYGSHSLRCKRSASSPLRYKKKNFELNLQSAGTNLGAKGIHAVRSRDRSIIYCALRLVHGDFACASENVTLKAGLIGVVRAPLVSLHPCDALLTVYYASIF